MAGEIPTPKLMDEETRLTALHRERIAAVTKQVEDIFLLENMTMGDMLEVFGLFTARANSVFEKTTIKKIKESYEI